MRIREYQQQALRTDRSSGSSRDQLLLPLLGLAGEAGSLLSEFKKFIREGERYRPFTDQVSEELGDILWYVSNIASKMNLDLQEIAEENLAKLADRWPELQPESPPLFDTRRYDAMFPLNEQLPRSMRVEFREVVADAHTTVLMSYEGRPLGDPLTDNAHVDDGYRYHDVAHLTHAILLGWSPVLRALMKRKRKSEPQIDMVEDGARAAVTEEAVSAVTYAYAKDHSFFEGVNSVDYELLRTIKMMTQPFEVRDRSPREWEHAILSCYKVWRALRENRGGIFVGDSEKGEVYYEPLRP